MSVAAVEGEVEQWRGAASAQDDISIVASVFWSHRAGARPEHLGFMIERN
jgi:hypothetical protein